MGLATVQPVSALELCPITSYDDLNLPTEVDDAVQVGNQLPIIKQREGSAGRLEQVAVTGDGTQKNYDSYDLMGGKK